MLRKIRKDLTIDDRKTIERLLKEGMFPAQIAPYVRRHKTCICREVRNNAGARNYNAEKAHENYLSNLNNRKIKQSNTLKEKSRIKKDTLEKRVEHLEMQIEILTDLFKQHRKSQ